MATRAKSASAGKRRTGRSKAGAKTTDRRHSATARGKSKAARSAKSAKRGVRKRTPARKPQKFAFNHLGETSFEQGLRAYAQYRDLGFRDATGGLVQAHVIRFMPPCRPEEVSKLHLHDVEFQMIYVLKGSITSEFEGQGTHTFRTGSCWIQPPRIKHKVLDYSDDCEVLEIVLPADFETVELEEAPAAAMSA